jgi:hypothetical protein
MAFSCKNKGCGRMCVPSQKDGTFMKVMVKLLCLLICESLWCSTSSKILTSIQDVVSGSTGCLKWFPSLGVYISVTLQEHPVSLYMSPLAELAPCGQGFWFLLLSQLVSGSRAKCDWPTICGLHLEHHAEASWGCITLGSKQAWLRYSDCILDYSNWLEVSNGGILLFLHSLVSESNRLLPT